MYAFGREGALNPLEVMEVDNEKDTSSCTLPCAFHVFDKLWESTCV